MALYFDRVPEHVEWLGSHHLIFIFIFILLLFYFIFIFFRRTGHLNTYLLIFVTYDMDMCMMTFGSIYNSKNK